jgi:hypothetical protein
MKASQSVNSIARFRIYVRSKSRSDFAGRLVEMRHKFKTAVFVCILATFGTCSAQAQMVPGLKRDLDFDAHVKTIDLDDSSLRLDYKKAAAGGSSLGLFIGVGDQPTDRSFVPTNTSSNPEAEVVSYRLARFLGVSRSYYPVDYYRLGPKATAAFRKMVLAHPEGNPDRVSNRDMVLVDLKAHPTGMLGIYRIKSKTKMYGTPSLATEGRFNSSSGLAQEIRAAGRMPDETRIPLAGVIGGQRGFPVAPTEQRVELARQLSTIFVIDQLLGQWDRFWNNLEASGDKNGRLKLIARDNGGATLDDWENHAAYSVLVTRFDRDVIERLTQLNAFLKGETKDFAGYTSVETWKEASGFIKPGSFKTFTQKLAHLIDKRVPALVAKFGDATYFPPKTAEIVALDALDTGEAD